MDWLCAGAGLLVLLSVGGLIALGGLILLLIKLGVIVRYATSRETQEPDAEYTLGDSKSLKSEESHDGG